MRINITILLSFLFLSVQLVAQQDAPEFDPNCNCIVDPVKSPVHVYRGHDQWCSVMYLEDINYIMELYPDSTFKISISQFHSGLQFQSRLSYCGRYEIIHDTIHMRYVSSSFQTGPNDIDKPPVDFRFYRPSTFALAENSIMGIGNGIPKLTEITLSERKELNSEVQSRMRKKQEFVTILKSLGISIHSN